MARERSVSGRWRATSVRTAHRRQSFRNRRPAVTIQGAVRAAPPNEVSSSPTRRDARMTRLDCGTPPKELQRLDTFGDPINTANGPGHGRTADWDELPCARGLHARIGPINEQCQACAQRWKLSHRRARPSRPRAPRLAREQTRVVVPAAVATSPSTRLEPRAADLHGRPAVVLRTPDAKAAATAGRVGRNG